MSRPNTDNDSSTAMTATVRRTQMYTMHEAFARERMSDVLQRRSASAAAARLARHAAAARRWERLERLAAASSERHQRELVAPAAATA